uniref:Uncharacterized protein n=1 Tax=Anguilla anguilla TaxID=7936 RepID=A0A0E9WPE9_ANGAN
MFFLCSLSLSSVDTRPSFQSITSPMSWRESTEFGRATRRRGPPRSPRGSSRLFLGSSRPCAPPISAV